MAFHLPLNRSPSFPTSKNSNTLKKNIYSKKIVFFVFTQTTWYALCGYGAAILRDCILKGVTELITLIHSTEKKTIPVNFC